MIKKSQRGAVTAEAALVTPFVLLLIMSIIWGALLFRTYLSGNHAAISGARQASVASTNVDADWQILHEMKPGLSAVNSKAIEKIIVYPASTYSDGPSSACLTSNVGCDVYTASDLNKPRPTSAGQWVGDANFPPTSRSVASSNSLIGVYIEINPSANGLLLPVPRTLTSFKVAKIEMN